MSCCCLFLSATSHGLTVDYSICRVVVFLEKSHGLTVDYSICRVVVFLEKSHGLTVDYSICRVVVCFFSHVTRSDCRLFNMSCCCLFFQPRHTV